MYGYQRPKGYAVHYQYKEQPSTQAVDATQTSAPSQVQPQLQSQSLQQQIIQAAPLQEPPRPGRQEEERDAGLARILQEHIAHTSSTGHTTGRLNAVRLNLAALPALARFLSENRRITYGVSASDASLRILPILLNELGRMWPTLWPRYFEQRFDFDRRAMDRIVPLSKQVLDVPKEDVPVGRAAVADTSKYSQQHATGRLQAISPGNGHVDASSAPISSMIKQSNVAGPWPPQQQASSTSAGPTPLDDSLLLKTNNAPSVPSSSQNCPAPTVATVTTALQQRKRPQAKKPSILGLSVLLAAGRLQNLRLNSSLERRLPKSCSMKGSFWDTIDPPDPETTPVQPINVFNKYMLFAKRVSDVGGDYSKSAVFAVVSNSGPGKSSRPSPRPVSVGQMHNAHTQQGQAGVSLPASATQAAITPQAIVSQMTPASETNVKPPSKLIPEESVVAAPQLITQSTTDDMRPESKAKVLSPTRGPTNKETPAATFGQSETSLTDVSSLTKSKLESTQGVLPMPDATRESLKGESNTSLPQPGANPQVEPSVAISSTVTSQKGISSTLNQSLESPPKTSRAIDGRETESALKRNQTAGVPSKPVAASADQLGMSTTSTLPNKHALQGQTSRAPTKSVDPEHESDGESDAGEFAVPAIFNDAADEEEPRHRRRLVVYIRRSRSLLKRNQGGWRQEDLSSTDEHRRRASSDNSSNTGPLKMSESVKFASWPCAWIKCGAVLHSFENLVKHCRKAHLKKSTLNEYTCQWAGCTFKRPLPTRASWESHLGEHLRLERFACPEAHCGKHYESAEQLEQHRYRVVKTASRKRALSVSSVNSSRSSLGSMYGPMPPSNTHKERKLTPLSGPRGKQPKRKAAPPVSYNFNDVSWSSPSMADRVQTAKAQRDLVQSLDELQALTHHPGWQDGWDLVDGQRLEGVPRKVVQLEAPSRRQEWFTVLDNQPSQSAGRFR